MSNINGLDLRRRLGRKQWGVPRPFGPDGWLIERLDESARIIATVAEFDGYDWTHASISRPETMPTYDDLVALHGAVWPGGYAYQVFAPPVAHINIHPYALHLWGHRDGRNVLPEFGIHGTI